MRDFEAVTSFEPQAFPHVVVWPPSWIIRQTSFMT